jgi:predicted nucleic acid-binding protein
MELTEPEQRHPSTDIAERLAIPSRRHPSGDEGRIGTRCRTAAIRLVDANVLIYANGAEHQNKPIALKFLRQMASKQIEAAIDGEAPREILHRYTCIGRTRDALDVYEMARSLFPTVLPITAAVVRVDNLEGICTFDRDVDNLSRIVP